MRMVSASTISIDCTGLTAWVKLAGLLSTWGMRAKVKTTSSGVKGVPSLKVTPGRSLNSQMRSSTGRQLSASSGIGR